MELKELTLIANDYADEQYSISMTKNFVNEAIAKINIALDIELPYFNSPLAGATTYLVGDTQNENYDMIKDSWQRMLFIPYIVYSIKANDGSQNESLLALQKFNQALQELKRSRSFDIPKKYRLRWYETTEYEYNLAEHKALDYTQSEAYDIDTEVLPRLGEIVETVLYVKYEDSFIRVNLANDIKKYYKLQDNKQAAVFKVGTGW